MSETMKQQLGLIRRPWGVFYLKNKIAGEHASLKTHDKAEAQRLLQARNESESQPQPRFNFIAARAVQEKLWPSKSRVPPHPGPPLGEETGEGGHLTNFVVLENGWLYSLNTESPRGKK